MRSCKALDLPGGEQVVGLGTGGGSDIPVPKALTFCGFLSVARCVPLLLCSKTSLVTVLTSQLLEGALK